MTSSRAPHARRRPPGTVTFLQRKKADCPPLQHHAIRIELPPDPPPHPLDLPHAHHHSIPAALLPHPSPIPRRNPLPSITLSPRRPPSTPPSSQRYPFRCLALSGSQYAPPRPRSLHAANRVIIRPLRRSPSKRPSPRLPGAFQIRCERQRPGRASSQSTS